ncbi:MAG: glycosyltransferase family 1 protein, partial [Gammaproteobacteria bacterium]|nr:glycosyltransferase family 1 protein [Gammaproteobacteria bacterium]
TESVLRKLIPKGGRWFLYSDRPLIGDYSDLGDVVVRVREKRIFPGALWAQWGFVRWAKIDAVDVFWSPRHHLPVLMPGKIKKLLTIHDLVWVRHPGSMTRLGWLLEFLLMPISLLLADQIISVSEFTADEIRKVFRISAGKIETIPLAAYDYPEDHRYDSDVPSEITKGDYFLFVGTPEPRKNLKRLLMAFNDLLSEVDGTPSLVIIGGNGWGNVKTSELVEELGLQRNVILLDHISDCALEQMYQHAMALVMPSLYEGFGLPILEAMSHGVPVITGNCSAMPEVAGDGALLVDPDSVAEIKASMSKLYADRELRTELSEKAGKQAENFSWQLTADQTLAQIKRLAGR